MAETILEIDALTKRFGGFTALNGVSIEVKAGERFGLIGPNGSGKTTLINCVSGSLPIDGRHIRFEGPAGGARPPPPRARPPPQRRRPPRCGGPRDRRAPAPPPDPARHRAQLPDPQALRQHDRAREP